MTQGVPKIKMLAFFRFKWVFGHDGFLYDNGIIDELIQIIQRQFRKICELVPIRSIRNQTMF